MGETGTQSLLRHVGYVEKKDILKTLTNERLLTEAAKNIERLKRASNLCDIDGVVHDGAHVNHTVGMLTDRNFRGLLDEKETTELHTLQNKLANIQYETVTKCKCSM